MSLLTIIQGACVKTGIPKPNTVIGNTDASVQQLLEIAQEDLIELGRKHPWQRQVVDVTWTTINAENQGTISTVIGPDFSRFAPGTIWDRSMIRPLPGPRTPQGWAQDHALIAAGPFYSFRFINGTFNIFPIPPAGSIISFEYLSRYLVNDAAGNLKETYTADTDITRIDELLVKQSIIVTYKMAKGMACQKDLADYQDTLTERMATDGGAPATISMNGSYARYPNWPVLPDGNWPVA